MDSIVGWPDWRRRGATKDERPPRVSGELVHSQQPTARSPQSIAPNGLGCECTVLSRQRAGRSRVANERAHTISRDRQRSSFCWRFEFIARLTVLNGFRLFGKIALAIHAASDPSIDAGAHLEKVSWQSYRKGRTRACGPLSGTHTNAPVRCARLRAGGLFLLKRSLHHVGRQP